MATGADRSGLRQWPGLRSRWQRPCEDDLRDDNYPARRDGRPDSGRSDRPVKEDDPPLPIPPVGSAVAGILSVALALGISELIAGISKRLESFVVAVAGVINDVQI